MRKRRLVVVAGTGALVVVSGVSIGALTVGYAQPNGGSLVPTAEEVAAKLDAVSNPSLAARGQEVVVSGEGPIPQILDPSAESFLQTTITNNVLDVQEDGPNRAVATRTINYLFPSGESVQTEPAEVPFVFEEGEWRVEREYLCRTVRMIEDINRADGFAAEEDPGCP